MQGRLLVLFQEFKDSSLVRNVLNLSSTSTSSALIGLMITHCIRHKAVTKKTHLKSDMISGRIVGEDMRWWREKKL